MNHLLKVQVSPLRLPVILRMEARQQTVGGTSLPAYLPPETEDKLSRNRRKTGLKPHKSSLSLWTPQKKEVLVEERAIMGAVIWL